ncbi:helix-turn-helix domain-containing protein [Diaphorobacter sp. HDW4A]|uniref:helix-turn-helix domain-containing protein n=1 Tax=Diaphorobacter sp. HDW4A TaxID=2714924 RepID=UPI00140819D4|nr:helix-turn-helix domain-containing protein [Diaphorobacter sp. HDW4A]QIL82409.1 helix-turn-helix domain-containing protein [Diaphorobacter sp. HDW4A]
MKKTPGTVRSFALYGNSDTAPAWAELVHLEDIPERSSRFDWEIDLHFHEGLLQLLYLTAGGESEAFIDGTRWVLRPPCLILVPARAVHGFSFHPQTDGPVITAAQKPLESLAALTAPGLLDHLRRPVVLEVAPDSRHARELQPLFEAIQHESQWHADGGMAAGMALLTALLVQVARVAATAPATAQSLRTRKALQIARFRSLLDEHVRRRESVSHYAQALGITPGQLSRLTREVLGISAQDVINARVVHEAQRELVYSSLAIKQIAAELGFEDEAYFGRFFKTHTGHRPTEFRTLARQQLA